MQLPKDGEPYSREALAAVAGHHLVRRTAKSSGADYSLAELALFNDIYFDYTKQCIREEFLIEKIVELFIRANPNEATTYKQLETAIKSNF